MCVPDAVKNLNVKVFSLVLGTNKTRRIEWHETCKCKCKFNGSICNNKQRWNDDKCRRECKELINKGVCDKELVWNPSNCKCECYKSWDFSPSNCKCECYNSCDFTDYLDYKNCKCKKRLVEQLIEECTGNIGETRLFEINLTECNSVENKYKHNSCTLYIVLFSILCTINVGIGSYCLCFYWYLEKDVIGVKFDTCT